jgi:uridine phosphorylase
MPPILQRKHHHQPSVFTVENMLREARRQKALPPGEVPAVCVLDPDGDYSRGLRDRGAPRDPHWACYHTELYRDEIAGEPVGVLGCAVGAPFAAVVTEELFASGCRFLVSVTSAGQLVQAGTPPYFILIERALRDEGTSYHYQPPADYAHIGPRARAVGQAAAAQGPGVVAGGVWTTDAPFRETAEAIAHARAEGLLAVEMEAAALYAVGEARELPILCYARVTNQLATVANDFEKGADDGNVALRELLSSVVRAWRATR